MAAIAATLKRVHTTTGIAALKNTAEPPSTNSAESAPPRFWVLQSSFLGVAVGRLDAEAVVGKELADFVGHHYRAVAAAGAAEGDGQVTLPFTDVVRNQVDQQLGDSLD